MKAIVCALVIGLIVPSFAGAAIENIQVSNNNNVSVTISWTTDSDVMGTVHYSQDPALSNPLTAYDVRGTSFTGCTHYVEITGLTKETTYYFEVEGGGETYTFTTMKQLQSPPTPCTITGCVYEEDGTTLAVGAMVYLRVTHGGVTSYPLSDLLGSPGDATPGCFALNIIEARSPETLDLFSSIDPADPLQVEAIGCGHYRIERSDLGFESCFSNIEPLTLAYTMPETTTTSASVTTTPTTVPTTTPTTVPTSTPTTVPTSTPTTVPGGGCTTDAECDDGVYCNGVESCDEEAGACVSSGDPCGGNELCSEEDDICKPAISVDASIKGCGFPLFARLGVVEIQGTGTDFKPVSAVRYDSPLVIKSLKLLNRSTQTITQFVILLPSFGSTLFTTLDYPATVTVTVDGLSDTFEIPACGR